MYATADNWFAEDNTKRNMEEKYIASIDLGTSKFGLCVARVNGEDIQIVYYKETPSEGIRTSLIANPMKAAKRLKDAIREAEQELMIQILQVVVGMPRSEVAQVTASARIERTNADDYISSEEVDSLKSIALETYPLSNPERQIMYGAVAQSFSIDDEIQLVESEVVGTLSASLEGNFKVFVGNRSATTALDKIFNQLDIAIAKKYFLPEVVARAVLTDDEMAGGVALVDVGAGVTSVSIYHGGIMRYYASIPFAGKVITNDIRTECSISEDLAEKIKKRFGACMPGKLASLSEKVLQIRLEPPFKEVPVRYISEIIDCRCREIVDAVLYYIQESGLQNSLRSGLVITGGGAELANFIPLIKDMSGYEVRKGGQRRVFHIGHIGHRNGAGRQGRPPARLRDQTGETGRACRRGDGRSGSDQRDAHRPGRYALCTGGLRRSCGTGRETQTRAQGEKGEGGQEGRHRIPVHLLEQGGENSPESVRRSQQGGISHDVRFRYQHCPQRLDQRERHHQGGRRGRWRL